MSEVELEKSADALTDPAAAQALPSRDGLHLFESWIVRAALIAIAVMSLGFSVVAKMAIDGLDAVAKMAHDDEVAASLADHLEKYKDIQELRQEFISERLKGEVRKFGDRVPISADEVKQLIKSANLPDWSGADKVKVSELGMNVSGDRRQTLEWLDKESLRIFSYVAQFPRGDLFSQFKAAETVSQKYQLLGVSLRERIQPSLVRAYGMAFFCSFLILVLVFTFLARGFRRRLRSLLLGFVRWSEGDEGFRFKGKWPGELRLVAQHFNRMADEVEANKKRNIYLEKIASWQIIARKLAHEIKNPLTPIQMIVSQLKRHYKGDDQDFLKLLENANSIITVEVAALRRLVDDFSNFARLPIPKRQPIDLRLIANQAIELEKTVFPQHEFSLKASEDGVIGAFDGELLRQVFINLLKNAAEACGEKPTQIYIELRDFSNSVQIRVVDHGPGIPAEAKERIFEAYFSTKNTGPSPGMGLGLAISQKIIIDHEGTVAVESVPGQTVFNIRLPKRAKKETQSPVAATAH